MHGPQYSAAHIFPTHIHVPKIGPTPEDHEAFVFQFLSDKRARERWQSRQTFKSPAPGAPPLPVPDGDPLLRKYSWHFNTSRFPSILICGHNSRDSRCGVLGPILRLEFIAQLGAKRWPVTKLSFQGFRSFKQRKVPGPMVSLISHIGGHAYAGNVIIYLPWRHRNEDGKVSELAGKGIWYGRVEPRHVEGIVEETIRKGRVIRELLRGIHINKREELELEELELTESESS